MLSELGLQVFTVVDEFGERRTDSLLEDGTKVIVVSEGTPVTVNIDTERVIITSYTVNSNALRRITAIHLTGFDTLRKTAVNFIVNSDTAREVVLSNIINIDTLRRIVTDLSKLIDIFEFKTTISTSKDISAPVATGLSFETGVTTVIELISRLIN